MNISKPRILRALQRQLAIEYRGLSADYRDQSIDLLCTILDAKPDSWYDALRNPHNERDEEITQIVREALIAENGGDA